MIKNIQEAQEFVKNKYPNTEEDYPARGKLNTEEEKTVFDIKHNLLHSSKLTGKMASLVEASDHGEIFDTEKAEDLLTKLQINVLVIANRLGLDSQKILESIPEKS